MKITLDDQQNDLLCSKDKIEEIVFATLEFKKIYTDEVIIHLVDTKTISQLHQEHFNDSSTTDCITFPIDHAYDQTITPHILGEMFICPKTAIDYAKKNKSSPLAEITLYIVHCILHMLDFKDGTEEDQLTMRKEEIQLITYLKSKNLFPDK